MAENQNQFKCTGNCLNCLPAQRAYCASQHAYSNMQVLDTMMGIVLNLKESVDDIKVKIEAIQSNEAMLFDPDHPASGQIGGQMSGQINVQNTEDKAQ